MSAAPSGEARDKVRVLFAIPSLDRGGPDRVLFEILKRIDRTRFTPSLMVNERGGYYESLLPSDIDVHALGKERGVFSRYPFLPALRHVWRKKPDVVFGTLRMNLTLGVVAPFLPKHTKLMLRPASPVSADTAALVEQSFLKHTFARRLLVETLRRADGVVCQGSAMRSDLAALGAENLHVVANPIDVDYIAQHADKRVELRGKPALVSVGRLVTLKGYDIALRVLAKLRAEYPGIHLTIIGDGPERGKLEDLARELDVTDLVTFMGYSREPLPYVKAADLFFLPSRYDAFCNATLEAIALGTPIVITDCPGANRELVNHTNGELAPSIEVDAIANALRTAIRRTFDRDAIRRDCRSRFASEQIVRDYERAIASVANLT